MYWWGKSGKLIKHTGTIIPDPRVLQSKWFPDLKWFHQKINQKHYRSNFLICVLCLWYKCPKQIDNHFTMQRALQSKTSLSTPRIKPFMFRVITGNCFELYWIVLYFDLSFFDCLTCVLFDIQWCAIEMLRYYISTIEMRSL